RAIRARGAARVRLANAAAPRGGDLDRVLGARSGACAREVAMPKLILVPLDGSPLGEQALPYAETLARASGARVVLVRAIRVSAFPGVDTTDAQVRAEQEAAEYLAVVAARLDAAGIAVETATPYGEAAAEILEEIGLRGADLVVMATRGRSGLVRLVHPGIAERVLVESRVPVLLVREGQPERVLARLDEQPPLLVPLDGSTFAEAALPVAAEVAEALCRSEEHTSEL